MIRGCVEFAASSGLLAGWVRDESGPDIELELSVHLDGTLLGYTSPILDRPDIGARSGYEINLDRPIRLLDLLTGRLQLRVRSSLSDGFHVLPPTERIAELAVEDFVDRDVSALRAEDSNRLFAEIAAKQNRVDDTGIAFRAAEQRRRQQLIDVVAGLPGSGTDGPSFFGLPVGYVSPDGTAIIGRDGTLFLIGGSNGLIYQYLQVPEDESVLDTAGRWVTLFQRRATALQQRGIDYLQIVIPEKLGVMRNRFPRDLPPASALLRQLEAGIAEQPALADRYLSVGRLFDTLSTTTDELLFPRTDSHLSFDGNFAVFAAILQRMDLSPPSLPTGMRLSPIEGDLSRRFFGVEMFDQIMLPSHEAERALSEGFELLEAVNPDGQHIGIRYVWRNPRAPFRYKVIAFGNSFFERGGDARCLSWWFARFFQEFHFNWRPDIDLAYVDREKPDWVLGQTIERFLPVVPQS